MQTNHVVRPWEEAIQYTRPSHSSHEQLYFTKTNEIQDKFTEIKASLKMILNEMDTARIPETTYLEREEMKTHLDIIESMLAPMYDYQYEDIWLRKEKRRLQGQISGVRVKIYDERSNFQPSTIQHATEPIATLFIRHRMDDICHAIFQIITMITDQEIDEWPISKVELINPMKQTIAFENVLLRHPCLTMHSERYIKARFAPTYISLAKQLKK